MQWMLMPLKRYADFSGRSRRMEFWMYQLLNVIVVAIGYTLVLAGGGMAMLTSAAAANGELTGTELEALTPGPIFWVGIVLLGLWGLGTLIPGLAVTVRRLHDRNMTGWYLLGFIVAVFILSLIPVLGALLALALEIGYIVILALPGTAGPNKYGPDPLGQANPEVFA